MCLCIWRGSICTAICQQAVARGYTIQSKEYTIQSKETYSNKGTLFKARGHYLKQIQAKGHFRALNILFKARGHCSKHTVHFEIWICYKNKVTI